MTEQRRDLVAQLRAQLAALTAERKRIMRYAAQTLTPGNQNLVDDDAAACVADMAQSVMSNNDNIPMMQGQIEALTATVERVTALVDADMDCQRYESYDAHYPGGVKCRIKAALRGDGTQADDSPQSNQQEQMRGVVAAAYRALIALSGDPEDCEDCGDLSDAGHYRCCRVHSEAFRKCWEAIEQAEDVLGPCATCGHIRTEHNDCDDRVCLRCECKYFTVRGDGTQETKA